MAKATAKNSTVPSFSKAAKDAGVPLQIKTEDVARLGTVTWLTAEEMTSQLPDGSPSEGYFCEIVDEFDTHYTVFIGGVALTRILHDVPLPFAASIEKSGRTWIFAD
jgi:hypothetical protein